MELWSALILGLAGSLHCAGMCGPLALALPAGGSGSAAFCLGRVAYNVGRICTYAALGLMFGWIGRTLALAGIQRWVSIALGLILIAGLVASQRLALWRPLTRLVETLKSGMGALLRQRTFVSLVVLGLLNGLLPCGLVYVACAGAATSDTALSGAAYMVAFGAGTFPMMLGIGLSGRVVPFKVRLKLRRATPISVFLLATLLILRGLALGIPYLSPNLAGGHCCH